MIDDSDDRDDSEEDDDDECYDDICDNDRTTIKHHNY